MRVYGPGDVLGTREAARLLGISPQATRKAIRTGRLAAVEAPGGTRLIAREELARFASSRTRGTSDTDHILLATETRANPSRNVLLGGGVLGAVVGGLYLFAKPKAATGGSTAGVVPLGDGRSSWNPTTGEVSQIDRGNRKRVLGHAKSAEEARRLLNGPLPSPAPGPGPTGTTTRPPGTGLTGSTGTSRPPGTARDHYDGAAPPFTPPATGNRPPPTTERPQSDRPPTQQPTGQQPAPRTVVANYGGDRGDGTAQMVRVYSDGTMEWYGPSWRIDDFRDDQPTQGGAQNGGRVFSHSGEEQHGSEVWEVYYFSDGSAERVRILRYLGSDGAPAGGGRTFTHSGEEEHDGVVYEVYYYSDGSAERVRIVRYLHRSPPMPEGRYLTHSGEEEHDGLVYEVHYFSDGSAERVRVIRDNRPQERYAIGHQDNGDGTVTEFYSDGTSETWAIG